MTKSTLALLLLAASLVAGCDKGDAEEGDPGEVAECELYFRRAEACFAKNPVAKATLSDGVDQVKAMLRPKRGEPIERFKMADLCKQRMATLAQSCN